MSVYIFFVSLQTPVQTYISTTTMSKIIGLKDLTEQDGETNKLADVFKVYVWMCVIAET